MEEEEPTGFVRYEKFEPVLCRILLERRYQPASEEQLLKAFKVIHAYGVVYFICCTHYCTRAPVLLAKTFNEIYKCITAIICELKHFNKRPSSGWPTLLVKRSPLSL